MVDWTLVSEQAAAKPDLRVMNDRARFLFDTIERRKYKRQLAFGGDLSVLSEYSAKRSAGYRRSLAAERVLMEMPVTIEPRDLIVGLCARDDRIVRCALPRFILKEEAGKETVRISHKAPGYAMLLEKGLLGLIDEVRREEEKCADPAWMDLAESMKREAYAVIALANRYADLALKQSRELPPDSDRAAELREIARVCGKVPAHPAESMHEAVQSIWLMNHAYHETEANLSMGCLDRIIKPYFEADYGAGRITLERAQELIDCFCLRVNDRAQIDPKQYVIPNQADIPHTTRQYAVGYGLGFVTKAENDGADAINHWGQNVLIGGVLPNGEDAVSAVTYMFLNAHEKFHMTSPVLTVRMHKGTPKTLETRVAEVLKRGGGMPYINNDDIIIPAYQALGVSFEDAADYANSNCWETLIQGRSSQEMIRGINFLEYLELALNRGQTLVHGKNRAKGSGVDPENPYTWPGSVCVGNNRVEGVDTGDPADFTTFAELTRAWRTQMDFMLQTTMEHVVHTVRTRGAMGATSYLALVSLLQSGCVENHRDVTRLGPRYTLWHLMAEAVSNAADALASIRRIVYEHKRMTLSELAQMLRGDWGSLDAEKLREECQYKTPKFGNDTDEVDELAADMVQYFVDRAAVHAKKYAPDFIFPPCIGTFSWIIGIGGRIGASMDGRKSRDPIAANMSPVPGCDVSGPTAAINSYLKLNTKPMAAGAPIDLRVSSTGLEGEDGTKRIAGLIRTFIRRGGNMMTLTITDIQELRNAIENPDAYRGLRVRMGGWSAYFTMLSKDAQKIHLKRVEHGLV
jgi:formate C-acetyltransferase